MPKLKYFNDKDPWMLGEDIPDIDFFFSQIWLRCFVNDFRYPSGRAYKKILTVYKGGYHLWFHFGTEDSKGVGDHLVKKFLQQPAFTKEVNRQIIIEADKLRSFAETIPEERLDRLSNKDLWRFYNRHFFVHSHYYRWCWIPVAVDMFHNNLTEKLKQYLRSIDVEESKVNEYLVILTQPTKKSLIQIEQEEFLQIASKVWQLPRQRKVFRNYWKLLQQQATAEYGLKTHTQEYEEFLEEQMAKLREKIDKKILKLLEKHYQKYFYVKFMWIGKEGVYSFDYYLKELVKLIGSNINPQQEFRHIRQEFKKSLQRRARLIKKLKIKNPWRTIIDAWGDFMVTKIYRRYAQIYAIYRMQPILKEIARRLQLTLKEVKSMTREEIKEGLIDSKVNRRQLQERVKLFVFYTERNNFAILTGKKAKSIVKRLQKIDIGEVNEIQGQTGCVGKAQGTVKIIIRPKDMKKMKKGDILVSIATDPDIVPAMKKAAAIVTEQGGVTSHAAIVSREMNIPCVIGTKIATRVLKDGDLVEVDATKGVVKILKK